MDLETLREEIRKKDSMIIELIAERTALAEEIAKVKIETNEPLRNLEVEKRSSLDISMKAYRKD